MLLLGLIALASADDCPERVTPEALSARVEAMIEPILFLEPDAFEALQDFEALLDGCVDGAMSPEQIARIWITLGAGELLYMGRAGPAAELRLGSALALVGPEGWLPVFGPDAEQAYLRAAPVALGGALLVLDFTPETLVVLDGQVTYARGPIPTTPGLHLVQWSEDGQWSGALLTLERGAQGSPRPPPAAAEPEAPRAPRPAPAATLRAELGAGYLAGRVVEGGYGVGGRGTRPAGALELRVGGRWWGALGVRGSLPGQDGLVFPAGLVALGGWQGAPGGVDLSLGAGVARSAWPTLVPPEDLPEPDQDFAPDFTRDRAPGLHLEARAPALLAPGPLDAVLGVEVGADLAPGLLRLTAGPHVSAPLGPLRPRLAWTPGLVVAEGTRLFSSALTLGATWSP